MLLRFLKKAFEVILLLFVSSSRLFAGERELLLFAEIPVVNIASKKPRKANESPLPVVVIDEDDIILSGARNVPELLRRVAGVDVLSISASDYNVSIRGFNQESSDKVLAMIDGRSVFLDFYGIVLWDALPISMNEIERIEIVKGPGSSIYGANAFNGVINIITKSPGEIDGTLLSLEGGEFDTFAGALVHGRRVAGFGYKFAVSRDQYSEWEGDNSRRHSTSGNFAIERQFERKSRIIFSGSIDESTGKTFTALDNFIRETT